MVVTGYISNAQYLSSARGVGIGAFTSLTDGPYSLDWNPAGLSLIKDWEVSISNYISTLERQSGFRLHSLGAGKSFFSNQAAAIIYSPGKMLEFVVPSNLIIYDSSGNILSTRYDKNISYHQSYALGYNYRISKDISVGMSARFFDSEASDTRYYFDTSNVIQTETEDHSASSWTFDLGMLYNMNYCWVMGLVFKNLFEIQEEVFKNEIQEYQLKLAKSMRMGIIYKGIENVSVGVDGDTRKKIQIGAEWTSMKWLQVRSGIYSNGIENIEAAAIGVGIRLQPIGFDISYLKFVNQTKRTNKIDINTFKSTSYSDIDYSPFTSDRFMLSMTARLGRTRETLARLEYVEMLNEVFTASHQIYAFQPLGKARVRNISSYPINAKVSFLISELMNAPTETGSYSIAPDEVIEIPFFAVFSDLITGVKKFSIYDGTVYVNAEIDSDYDDRYQTRVLVRGRNDWDGDVMLLRYFVTPDDPDVIKFTRRAINSKKAHLDSVPTVTQNFEKAKVIFNSMAERLQYVQDPKKSKDFVQYPSETLALNGGDCDDITVCYSSLLMSIGISTAFIDIIPPQNPEDSHIYMMFDTGIDPKEAHILSENPKRYIVRKNDKGTETIWIAIETTAITKSFEKAWDIGAQAYLQDAEINLGQLKGWMRVVEVPSTN